MIPAGRNGGGSPECDSAPSPSVRCIGHAREATPRAKSVIGVRPSLTPASPTTCSPSWEADAKRKSCGSASTQLIDVEAGGASQGFTSVMPIPSKSFVLRVARVAPAVRQIAAISASKPEAGRPSARRVAMMFA